MSGFFFFNAPAHAVNVKRATVSISRREITRHSITNVEVRPRREEEESVRISSRPLLSTRFLAFG